MASPLGLRKKDYNGLSIFELASLPDIPATSTFRNRDGNDTHMLHRGTFTIDRTEGSYLYGDELQFCLWSREPPKIKVHRAANDGYYRIEVAVPLAVGKRLLEDALARLYALERASRPLKTVESGDNLAVLM